MLTAGPAEFCVNAVGVVAVPVGVVQVPVLVVNVDVTPRTVVTVPGLHGVVPVIASLKL